ncbi:MAG: YidH family protein [Candidatus Dormibacteria bacterium]
MSGDPGGGGALRDRLAGHRTVLAWLRTGISLAGLGFVVAKFGLFLRLLSVRTQTRALPSAPFSGYLGVALVLMGAATMLLGYLQHRSTLRAGAAPDPDLPAEWPVAVLVGGCVVASVALAVYLLIGPGG